MSKQTVRETLNEFKEHEIKLQSSLYHEVVKKLIADNLLTQAELDSIILNKSREIAFLNLWKKRRGFWNNPKSLSLYYWKKNEKEFKSSDLGRIYLQDILKQVDKIMELTPEQFLKIKTIIVLILEGKISVEQALELESKQAKHLFTIQDEIIKGKVSVDDFLKWAMGKTDGLIDFAGSFIRSNMDLKQIDTLPSQICISLNGCPDSTIAELVNSNLISEIKNEQLNNLKIGIDCKILPIPKALKLSKKELNKLEILREYINKKEITVETALAIDPKMLSKIKMLAIYPSYHRFTKFKELIQLLKDDKNDFNQVKILYSFIPHRMSLPEALRHRVSAEEQSIIENYRHIFDGAKLSFDDAISFGKKLSALVMREERFGWGSTQQFMRIILALLLPQLGILSEDKIIEILRSLASTVLVTKVIHLSFDVSVRKIVTLAVTLVTLDYAVKLEEILDLGKYEIYILDGIMKVIIANYLNKLLELLVSWINVNALNHLILEFLDFTPPRQSSSHKGQTSTPLATNVLTLFAHSAQEILASTQVRTDEHLNQP